MAGADTATLLVQLGVGEQRHHPIDHAGPLGAEREYLVQARAGVEARGP